MSFGFSSGRRVLGAAIAASMIAGSTIASALPLTGVDALGARASDVATVQFNNNKPQGGAQHQHAPGGGQQHAGQGQHWHGGGGGGGGGGYWNNGQWIVPGLALGVLGAAAAAATYGQPPAPGMCWYYNDPSQTSGFWDYCQ